MAKNTEIVLKFDVRCRMPSNKIDSYTLTRWGNINSFKAFVASEVADRKNPQYDWRFAGNFRLEEIPVI